MNEGHAETGTKLIIRAKVSVETIKRERTILERLWEKKMLNRTVLILRYKEPALRWINENDPDSPPMTLEEVNDDKTVYLVADDAADSPEQIRRWLKKNFRFVFESELEGWYTDEDMWPAELTLKLFEEWFDAEFHGVILDTVDGPLEDDGL
jgi:hypothetical protein